MAKYPAVETRVVQILKEHSDEDHPLRQTTIRSKLLKEYGIVIGVKKLRRILYELVEIGEISYDQKLSCARVKPARDGQAPEEEELRTGFFYLHPLTTQELRFLIDQTAYFPFLTDGFKNGTLKALRGLASAHFEHRPLFIDGKTRPSNAAFLRHLEILDEAIRENKKVTFKYTRYGADAQTVPRTGKDGSERVYILSPYQFAISGGKYYIVCCSDRHDALAHYRVDRMLNVQKTDDQRRPLSEIFPDTQALEMSSQLDRYCREHAFMLAGKSVTATLRMSEHVVNELYDLFGDCIANLRQSGESYTARVHANPIAIRRFVKSNTPDAEVLEPPELRQAVFDELQAGAGHHTPL